jgi:hypothetical protein
MLSPHEQEFVEAIHSGWSNCKLSLRSRQSSSSTPPRSPSGSASIVNTSTAIATNSEAKAIGIGPKAPIRFDPEVALASFGTSPIGDKPAPTKTPRLLRRPGTHAPLLPVKEKRS